MLIHHPLPARPIPMLTSLLLALAVLLQDPAPAAGTPAPTEKLALAPVWQQGTRFALELTKAREDWNGETLLKASRTRTPIDVEVRTQGPTGWVVRWTYGHTSILEGADKDKEFAERMASLSEGMQLDVRLSTAGVIEGLADPEGLQRHYAQMLADIEKGLLQKGMDARTVAQLRKQTAERVLGPDFQHLALSDVEIYQRCQTLELRPAKLGARTTIESELDNPLGGDPFPAQGWYLLESLDPAAKRAVVSAELTLDAVQARERVLAWLTEVAKQNGQPPPQGPDDLPLKELRETSRYELDLATALPVLVEHVRTSVIRAHKRVDRTELRRVETTGTTPAAGKPR